MVVTGFFAQCMYEYRGDKSANEHFRNDIFMKIMQQVGRLKCYLHVMQSYYHLYTGTGGCIFSLKVNKSILILRMTRT